MSGMIGALTQIVLKIRKETKKEEQKKTENDGGIADPEKVLREDGKCPFRVSDGDKLLRNILEDQKQNEVIKDRMIERLVLEQTMEDGFIRCVLFFIGFMAFILMVYTAYPADDLLPVHETITAKYGFGDMEVNNLDDITSTLQQMAEDSRYFSPGSQDYVDDKLGRAYLGDKVRTPPQIRVSLHRHPQITQNFTIGVWLKTFVRYGSVIRKIRDGGQICYDFEVERIRYGQHETTKPLQVINPAAQFIYLTKDQQTIWKQSRVKSQMEDGEWHHLAIIVNTTHVIYAHDAILEASTPLLRKITDCDGGDVYLGDATSRGEMVSFRWFPRALSQSELLETVSAGKPLDDLLSSAGAVTEKSDRSDALMAKLSDKDASDKKNHAQLNDKVAHDVRSLSAFVSQTVRQEVGKMIATPTTENPFRRRILSEDDVNEESRNDETYLKASESLVQSDYSVHKKETHTGAHGNDVFTKAIQEEKLNSRKPNSNLYENLEPYVQHQVEKLRELELVQPPEDVQKQYHKAQAERRRKLKANESPADEIDTESTESNKKHPWRDPPNAGLPMVSFDSHRHQTGSLKGYTSDNSKRQSFCSADDTSSIKINTYGVFHDGFGELFRPDSPFVNRMTEDGKWIRGEFRITDDGPDSEGMGKTNIMDYIKIGDLEGLKDRSRRELKALNEIYSIHSKLGTKVKNGEKKYKDFIATEKVSQKQNNKPSIMDSFSKHSSNERDKDIEKDSEEHPNERGKDIEKDSEEHHLQHNALHKPPAETNEFFDKLDRHNRELMRRHGMLSGDNFFGENEHTISNQDYPKKTDFYIKAKVADLHIKAKIVQDQRATIDDGITEEKRATMFEDRGAGAMIGSELLSRRLKSDYDNNSTNSTGDSGNTVDNHGGTSGNSGNSTNTNNGTSGTSGGIGDNNGGVTGNTTSGTSGLSGGQTGDSSGTSGVSGGQVSGGQSGDSSGTSGMSGTTTSGSSGQTTDGQLPGDTSSGGKGGGVQTTASSSGGMQAAGSSGQMSGGDGPKGGDGGGLGAGQSYQETILKGDVTFSIDYALAPAMFEPKSPLAMSICESTKTALNNGVATTTMSCVITNICDQNAAAGDPTKCQAGGGPPPTRRMEENPNRKLQSSAVKAKYEVGVPGNEAPTVMKQMTDTVTMKSNFETALVAQLASQVTGGVLPIVSVTKMETPRPEQARKEATVTDFSAFFADLDFSDPSKCGNANQTICAQTLEVLVSASITTAFNVYLPELEIMIAQKQQDSTITFSYIPFCSDFTYNSNYVKQPGQVGYPFDPTTNPQDCSNMIKTFFIQVAFCQQKTGQKLTPINPKDIDKWILFRQDFSNDKKFNPYAPPDTTNCFKNVVNANYGILQMFESIFGEMWISLERFTIAQFRKAENYICIADPNFVASCHRYCANCGVQYAPVQAMVLNKIENCADNAVYKDWMGNKCDWYFNNDRTIDPLTGETKYCGKYADQYTLGNCTMTCGTCNKVLAMVDAFDIKVDKRLEPNEINTLLSQVKLSQSRISYHDATRLTGFLCCYAVFPKKFADESGACKGLRAASFDEGTAWRLLFTQTINGMGVVTARTGELWRIDTEKKWSDYGFRERAKEFAGLSIMHDDQYDRREKFAITKRV